MYKSVFGLVFAGTLTALSGNTQADRTIFKCKTEQGMVYQKTPCAESGEIVKSWTAPEETGKAKKKLSLEPGYGGHYFLDSEINGNAVTFVIDTGASVVSLPNSVAAKAELNCRRPVTMQTANGLANACTTVIDKLKLGDFLIRDVEAVIVPNLAQPLLGMNVLQRFSISQEGDRMRITER